MGPHLILYQSSAIVDELWSRSNYFSSTPLHYHIKCQSLKCHFTSNNAPEFRL